MTVNTAATPSTVGAPVPTGERRGRRSHGTQREVRDASAMIQTRTPMVSTAAPVRRGGGQGPRSGRRLPRRQEVLDDVIANAAVERATGAEATASR